MKNRPTNHPSDKSPNATREALNQEQAVSQALLRSFEATRSPWWTTVSAGVMAVSLGMAGVGQAQVAVTGGTAATALSAAPGAVTFTPKSVTLTGVTLNGTTTVTVADTTGLQPGMVLVGPTATGLNGQTIVSITNGTNFVISSAPLSSNQSFTATVQSEATVSASTTFTQLMGADSVVKSPAIVVVNAGRIKNTSASAVALSINSGSFGGDIETNYVKVAAGTEGQISVVKDTAGILTLSGDSNFNGLTLAAGQLRVAGASTGAVNNFGPFATTTGTGVALANTITVASTVGLEPTMVVVGGGLPAGTQIVSILGNVVTLNQNVPVGGFTGAGLIAGYSASGPLGRGTVTIKGGQLSGENGITSPNPIDINDGVASLGTVLVKLGTYSDSRANANNQTDGGSPSPVLSAPANSFNLTGKVSLTDNAVLEVLSSVNLANTVSGAGRITKTGEGVLRMGGANTYTGGTTLEVGELRADSDSLYNKANPGGPLGTTAASKTVTTTNASAYSVGQFVNGAVPGGVTIPPFGQFPTLIAKIDGNNITLSQAATSALGVTSLDSTNGVLDSYTASRYALGEGTPVALSGGSVNFGGAGGSSTTITNVTNVSSLKIGQAVSGTGIAPGTTIADINVATKTVTLSLLGVQDFAGTAVAGLTPVALSAKNLATGAFGTGTVVLKGGILSGNAIVANAVDIGDATNSATVSVELGRPGTDRTSAGGSVGALDDGDRLVLSGATRIQQTANITVGAHYDAATDNSYNKAYVLLAGPVSGKGFTKLGDGELWLGNYAVNVATGVQDAVSNSYTGRTIIKAGKLGITDKTDLGASTVKFTGGKLDLSVVSYARQAASATGDGFDIASKFESIDLGQEAVIVGGKTDPVATTLANVQALAPAVALGNRAVFTTGLSGAGGLSVDGGELQVANVNTYTGSTSIDNGAALFLPRADSITNSSSVKVEGFLDASAVGFAFRQGQPVEVRAKVTAETNTVNSHGYLRVKDGTSNWANANLAVDISSRVGNSATGASPSITQTGVGLNKSSTAVSGLVLKLIPRSVYVVGVEQVESSQPVSMKDYFAAEEVLANGTLQEITDRARVGAVSGTMISARPIYKLNWTKDGDALTWTRQSYGVFGQGQNGANFGAYLDKQISATSTEKVPAYLRKVDANFTEASTFTRLINEISAQPFADMYRSGLGRSLAVLGGLEDRINSLATSASEEGASRKFGYKQATPAPTRAAAPVASTDDEWAAWLSVYDRESSDKALGSDGASKLKNSETGTQMGVERRVGSLKVGLTGATGWGRSTFDTPSTQISSDSWHVGLYTIAPINQLTLDASFMYGLVSNTSNRTPHTNALFGDTTPDSNTYHGKFDSRDLSLSIGAAYNLMQAGSAFQMAPVVRLTYVNYSQSAFSETEAQAAAYKVDKMDAGTFLSKLGYRVSYTKRAGSVDLGADLGAYWQHDWDNSGRSVNASLKGGLDGTSYSAVSRKGSSDSALLNGGLQITFSDKYTLRGSAGAEFGGDRNDLNGTVTFGIKF